MEIKLGNTLWDHSQKLGIQIPSTCGGKGECGKCVVKIEKGMDALSEKSKVEGRYRFDKGERLACQAKVISDSQDIHVLMKAAGEYSILTESVDGYVPLDPLIYRRGETVFHRGFQDQSPGKYEGELLGLAIDVGTTTLVVQLLDLETGEAIATSACKNPQITYGEDVISRIGFTDQHNDGVTRLQKVILDAVNSLLQNFKVCLGREINGHIYEAVVVGNPTMRNLFFGQSVHSLGISPFEPESTSLIYEKASEIGLQINPEAYVYGAPLVAGQVGADCLSVILVCDLHKKKKPCMAVDIGTNGEVAVGNKERIVAASNAAGGAFEGATVSCGVGAIEGAIKNMWIKDGDVSFETIGNKPPIGICGSGLIDLLAEMLREGIINEMGRFSEVYQDSMEFVVSEKETRIILSQKDINELRLARAGFIINQKTLMREYGIDVGELDTIYLVGGFGNFVNTNNAVAIGILPKVKGCLVKIGNGALAGARQMLLSRARREDTESLARRIEHVRLFEEENLLDLYVNELSLKSWP